EIYPAGSFIVRKANEDILEEMASQYGIDIYGLDSEPKGEMIELYTSKVGLYKSWRATSDEGWTRWLLDQYHFEVDSLHNAEVQSGNLAQYQTIILPSQRASRIMKGYSTKSMPEKYAGGLGEEGARALKK